MECPHLEKDTGASAMRKLQGLGVTVWSCEGSNLLFNLVFYCEKRTSGYVIWAGPLFT